MQLSSITSFLEKYRTKLSQEDDKQNAIVEALLSVAHVQVTSAMISVDRGTLTVNASPVIKNELFMHKEKILVAIRERGRTDIFDIR